TDKLLVVLPESRNLLVSHSGEVPPTHAFRSHSQDRISRNRTPAPPQDGLQPRAGHNAVEQPPLVRCLHWYHPEAPRKRRWGRDAGRYGRDRDCADGFLELRLLASDPARRRHRPAVLVLRGGVVHQRGEGLPVVLGHG